MRLLTKWHQEHNDIASAQAINTIALFLHLLHLTGSLLIKFIFQADMVWALWKASLRRRGLFVSVEQKSNVEIWKQGLASASSKEESCLSF